MRFLVVGYGLAVVGAVVLALSYAALPELVPLYRAPWGGAVVMGAKSPLFVGRIVALGTAQLGAVTVMAVAAREVAGWLRFWRWAAVAAGAKTLFECVGFAAGEGTGLAHASFALTVVPIALFVAAALVWWRRGELRAPPRLHARAKVWLGVWLLVWAASALLPRLLGRLA